MTGWLVWPRSWSLIFKASAPCSMAPDTRPWQSPLPEMPSPCQQLSLVSSTPPGAGRWWLNMFFWTSTPQKRSTIPLSRTEGWQGLVRPCRKRCGLTQVWPAGTGTLAFLFYCPGKLDLAALWGQRKDITSGNASRFTHRKDQSIVMLYYCVPRESFIWILETSPRGIFVIYIYIKSSLYIYIYIFLFWDSNEGLAG